jgi:hypothetical protein
MKNYSLAYPRTFSVVCALDDLLAPAGKLVPFALIAAEIREFSHDVNHLSPLQIVALTVLNIVYLTLFHAFAEKKGQIFLTSLAGKFKQRLVVLLHSLR